MIIPIIAIIVFVVLVIVVIFAIIANKEKQKEFKRTGKYPKGHYMSLGIALGIALGLPIGIVMDNLALGPGLGVAIGVAIGAALEKKNKDKIRPLTKEEKKMQGRAAIIGLVLFALGILAFLAMVFLTR
jgi:hypothetical protein